jgi:hypothetical protein
MKAAPITLVFLMTSSRLLALQDAIVEKLRSSSHLGFDLDHLIQSAVAPG